MRIESQIRCGLAAAGLVLGGVTWLAAQTPQAKPSAAVSALPAAQPTGVTGQVEAAPAAPAPAHHVSVEFMDGKLAVQANNASLNEILREVARKTGMKITGGVADDKVFGNYGPSTPAVVLDALLDGTGSNMLLVDDAKGGSELILTPRRGGVTPPNPNATQTNNESEDTGPGAYVPPVRPYQPPLANGRGPGAGPDPQVIAPGFNSDGGEGKSPQEIYEQLQRSMQAPKQTSSPPQ